MATVSKNRENFNECQNVFLWNGDAVQDRNFSNFCCDFGV